MSRTTLHTVDVQFGDCDVEMRAQFVFQRAHDLSLIFERRGCFDTDVEREMSNHGAVGSEKWEVISQKPRAKSQKPKAVSYASSVSAALFASFFLRTR